MKKIENIRNLKEFESINNSKKFGKTELKKIRGGGKPIDMTGTHHSDGQGTTHYDQD